MSEIVIDKEFKSLIPPLTKDEYDGLEQSILAEGCRDALVIWDKTEFANSDYLLDSDPAILHEYILLDGHNRYEICKKYGLQFNTKQMFFRDRDDAIYWIIKNQFGRRNLSAYDRARLVLRLKPVIAERAKEQQIRTKENRVCQISDKQAIDTKKELATVAGISHDTIAKVEKIEAMATPDIKEKLSAGEMSINQAYKNIKLQGKHEEIKQAERKIAEEASEGYKPIIHVGDSIRCVPTNKYDLLLTDPPYSTDVDNIEKFVDSWLYNALDNVKDTGSAYIFIGAYPDEMRAYLNAKTPKHIKLVQSLIWTYKNTLGQNPKDRYKQNYQVCLYYRGVNAPGLNCPMTSEQWAVIDINAPDGRQGDRYHAWQKPIEIGEMFIRHSTKKGDTVYDPFCCTGTFLLAAAKLGRKSFGVEINPDNAKIAIDRGCIEDVE